MLEEVGWKKPSETFLFNIFEKKENGNGDERTKGFGQDVWKRDRISSRRERGEKKEFLPLRFRKRISEVGCTQTRLYVCMCVEVARTITFPPTFFRFSSSLWILVGKGNFSAGWHSRALVKRRRHSAQLPILSVVRSTSTRERETGEWLIEREREREIKINAGERIIRPL